MDKKTSILSNVVNTYLNDNEKRKDINRILKYVFFGVLTTLFSFGSFWLLTKQGLNYIVANTISVVLTKILAYITSKFFVFQKSCKNFSELFFEFVKYIMARGFSGLVEMLGIIVLVDLLFINELLSKLVLIVIVMIINYILSKKYVFK